MRKHSAANPDIWDKGPQIQRSQPQPWELTFFVIQHRYGFFDCADLLMVTPRAKNRYLQDYNVI